ncbi:MAG: hypothetical protein RL662_614 [Bacteroidota bacterium]|jgi:outer membrane autotransporter protein
MKKVLLSIALVAVTTLGVFAQTGAGEKSVLLQLGSQTDPGRFMLGVQGRYSVTDNIRIAPDVMFLFPKDKVTGLDVNINAHYVLDLQNNLTVYPLAGFAIQNNRYAGETIAGVKQDSDGFTDIGFNLGAGAGYSISDNTYVNAELKYTFGDFDHFTIGVGYGIKF